MPTRRDVTTAAIADAFATLTREGRPVTVRALREEAGVGTDAAREWLAKNRPARDVPTVPTEVLAPVFAPLWSAAVAAARDENAESVAAEREALLTAEAAALQSAEQAIARADAADARITTLTAELEKLRTDLAASIDRAQAAEAAAATARDTAAAEIAAERDRARTAEQTAAAAQATATTLREVVDTLNTRDRSGK
ncbi:DNA-binding protein [Gordonia rhizosphera]|uniref:Uncharacterized protein n=1 Tax=Gordonia rhizosphera NBRC 16068 TaxID=1108045 RepID=K6W7F2_9ACTN|nr:DNA-binding protein [Gordonia rhizosphera]GAB88147.1 hypothetical protein GORHZ_006_00160 [Gordonia rhizosphera NBRC 16068]